MSWLTDILGTVGDIGKYAAIPLAFTGVGAPVAAGIGAAGGALGTLNDPEGQRGAGDFAGNILTGGAMGGLAGLGAGALGGVEGAGGSALKGLLSQVQAHPMQAGQIGLAGLSAVEGSRQQAKINKLIEEEIERQKKMSESRLPYQGMLLEQMEALLGTERPDLSGIFGQTQNPFAARRGM